MRFLLNIFPSDPWLFPGHIGFHALVHFSFESCCGLERCPFGLKTGSHTLVQCVE